LGFYNFQEYVFIAPKLSVWVMGGRSMKLQQLKYLNQVIKNDFNITHAANALYTSQPGVSKQLRLLEQELGVEIFMRSGQKLHGLTEAGAEVYEIARRILMASTELQEAAHHFSNRNSGRLTVATTHLHARYSLLPVIQRFAKKYPAVHLNLIQSSPDEIDAMLAEGAADIGISTSNSTAYPDLVRLKAKVLYRCLITPKDHPLVGISKPSMRDIASYPMIVYDSRLSSGWIVQETFEKKGIQPNIVLTAVDADVIKAYVAAGVGVSILQELAYDPHKDTELDVVSVRHLFPPVDTNVIIHRAKYMRQFTFDFIAMFAPRWRREVVKQALSR
jgi:DNA-binding transcriptional LysR family regulator